MHISLSLPFFFGFKPSDFLRPFFFFFFTAFRCLVSFFSFGKSRVLLWRPHGCAGPSRAGALRIAVYRNGNTTIMHANYAIPPPPFPPRKQFFATCTGARTTPLLIQKAFAQPLLAYHILVCVSLVHAGCEP